MFYTILLLLLFLSTVHGVPVINTGHQKIVDYTATFNDYVVHANTFDLYDNLLVIGANDIATDIGEVWIYEYNPGTKLWSTTPEVIAGATSNWGKIVSTDGTYIATSTQNGDDIQIFHKPASTWVLYKDFTGDAGTSFPIAMKLRNSMLFACNTNTCRGANVVSSNSLNGPYSKSGIGTSDYWETTISLADDGEMAGMCTRGVAGTSGCNFYKVYAGFMTQYTRVSDADLNTPYSFQNNIGSGNTFDQRAVSTGDGVFVTHNTYSGTDNIALEDAVYCSDTETSSYYTLDFAQTVEGKKLLAVASYQNDDHVCIYRPHTSYSSQPPILQKKIKFPSTETYAGFGFRVFFAGTDKNVMVVSSYRQSSPDRGIYAWSDVNYIASVSLTHDQKVYEDTPAIHQFFGDAVKIKGNLLMVASPGGVSNGYVAGIEIHKRATRVSSFVMKYNTRADGTFTTPASTSFGKSIEIGTNWAFSSAKGETVPGEATTTGRVHRFKTSDSGETWVFDGTIDPPAGQYSTTHTGWFGESMSVDTTDTWLIIGMPFDGYIASQSAGSVFFYENVAGTWTYRQKFAYSNDHGGNGNGRLGSVVIMTDDDMAVACSSAGGGASEPSFCRIFTLSGGTWSFDEDILTPGANEEFFASSIDYADSKLFIVASDYNLPYDDSGAVYVYNDQGGTWTLLALVTIPEGEYIAARPGRTNVAVDGDLGIWLNGYTSADNIGHYIKYLGSDTWEYSHEITSSDVSTSFGAALAVDEYSLVVGAIKNDDSYANNGAIYVYAIEPLTPFPTAAPSTAPTAAPTAAPIPPTLAPSDAPSAAPSGTPTGAPSGTPTAAPTAAPSVAPTMAPTLECYVSADCTDVDHYCNSINKCDQTACTEHADCYGLVLPTRLPYCHAQSGYCKDRYGGSCSNLIECISETKKAHASANGLATVKSVISAATGAVRSNATLELVSRTKLTLQPDDVVLVQNSETGTFAVDVINEVGEAQFLIGLKNTMCGDFVASCEASIDTYNRRMLLRELQAEVVVSITYEIDDAAYAEISEGGLDSGDFDTNLATELGIDVSNIVITAVSGDIVVSITLVEEGNGQDPIGEQIIEDIQQISSTLTSITGDLVAELPGLDAGDVENVELNLCEFNTCSGRGYVSLPETDTDGCNITTGVCNCLGDWWGITCETQCTCENGRTCLNAICHCQYPEYGLRCELLKDCSACFV